MAALGHLPRAGRHERAEALLALVHLSSHGDRRPADLSGGERQRVAVARALARDPAVLLARRTVGGRRSRRSGDTCRTRSISIRRSLDIPVVLVTHDFDDVVRLATHLLILEKGRGVGFGLLTDLTSRPDLPWVRDAVGLGSVFDAVVSRSLPARGLVELRVGNATLLTSDRSLTEGARIRVRIPAREVILATRPPEGVSLHNVLSGTITNIHLDPAFEHAIVQVAVGDLLLLAEITRDAVTTLGLAPGGSIHALVKSVSIELA